MTQPLEIALMVSDLDRLARFYVGLFGFEELRRSQVPAAINDAVGVGGATTNLILATPRGERIKLIRPELDPEPTGHVGALSRHAGLRWMTIYVENAETILDRADEFGGRVVSDPPLTCAAGKRFGFCADPEANMVEVVDMGG